MQDELHRHLEGKLTTLDKIDVSLNTLDDPSRGVGGMYLTVLGTSADGADGGQVGRGNRVNGLISLHRPMSTEAAAGKNPVSHVGKIWDWEESANIDAYSVGHWLLLAITTSVSSMIWVVVMEMVFSFK